MRIATWNVNSLRSALRKGFESHVATIEPDVLMLQEVRATPDQLPWTQPAGWHAEWHPAEKPGYAGTATWIREGIGHTLIGTGIRGAPDPDGRVLRMRVEGIELVNVYLPSGSAGDEAQAKKDRFMEAFGPFLRELVSADHPVVVGGDMNIVPTAQDIHNPSSNKNTSGFLPHERAWFASMLEAGWVDLVRRHFGDIKGPYSWWSNRGRARAEDRGWRIDHLLGNAAAADRLVSASIHRAGGLEVSDHAPVIIELSS